MKESSFQKHIIDRVRREFEGAIVLKNDSSYMQGIPDLTIFFKDHWAMLECKVSPAAKHQANQDYYIDRCNEMSFASFIFPENEEEVFDGLRKTFRP